MKSRLLKAMTGLAILISSSFAHAAITHYENTNTNSLVYGSYDFDDVLNTFSNIALKANFTSLQGPTNIDIHMDSEDADVASLQGTIITEGSRDETYYRYVSGSFFFKTNPDLLIVSTFDRWEADKIWGTIDYVNGLTPPLFFAEYLYFTAKPRSVSSVPEPDVLGLLLISPILLLARNRNKQQK